MSLDAIERSSGSPKSKSRSGMRRNAATNGVTEHTDSPSVRSRARVDTNDDDRNQGHKRKRKTATEQKTAGVRKRQRIGLEEEVSRMEDVLADIAVSPSRKAEHVQAGTIATPALLKGLKKSKSKRRPDWVLSQGIGGRFLPVDPLFSEDEQFLILATRQAVLVYTKRDSLLYRKVDLAKYGHVTCVATSSIHHSRLYVGTSSGHLIGVDWLSGAIYLNNKICSSINAITTCRVEDTETEDIYILETVKNAQAKTGTRLCRFSISNLDQMKVLLDVSRPLRDFRVLSGGRAIVAVSDRHVFLGLISATAMEDSESRSVWHQVESTDPIVSIDTRERKQNSSPGKSSSKGPKHMPKIDLAVGTVRGAIHVHEDFVTKLTGSGLGKQGVNSTVRPIPRILHWHRGPVSSVKWSLDGNYLISGGTETVLSLWQMKTGKRQDLPHLGSAIDCLTVSPSGTSYAVQLADNSVVILSTADLEASAHISGIQSRVVPFRLDHVSHVRTVEAELAKDLDDFDISPGVVATIHPMYNNRLLLAVPASQPKTEPPGTWKAAPFLQTFDLATAHNISRQALTRNNVTSLATGPESNRISEPDVKFIQVSQDGQWLATVEEWLPPRSDLGFMAEDNKDYYQLLRERGVRLEVYLKFWKWDSSTNMWSLETRIDSPHQYADDTIPARVQTLVADPVRNEFATTGEDGTVKFWRLNVRHRNEVVVRGLGGAELAVWLNRLTVELEDVSLDIEDGSSSDTLPKSSRIAYSEDGSVLVACQEDIHHSSNGTAKLVDTSNGKVVQSRPDLVITGLRDVGLLGKYLVILSNSLIVYDLVNDELSFQLDLPQYGYRDSTVTQLAVNKQSGTFAIISPTKRMTRSKVNVFQPSSSTPVYTSPKLDAIMAIFSLSKSSGYVLLNDQAEAKTLNLSTSASTGLLNGVVTQGTAALAGGEELPPVEPDVSGDLQHAQDLAAHGTVSLDGAGAEQDEDLEEGEEDSDSDDDGTPVVRPQQLAALFEDRPSYAMPPVKDMFNAILGLYGKQPRAKRSK